MKVGNNANIAVLNDKLFLIEVLYSFCLSHLSVLFKCVNASSGIVGIGFPSRARRVRPGTRVKAERGSTRRRLKPRSRT